MSAADFSHASTLDGLLLAFHVSVQARADWATDDAALGQDVRALLIAYNARHAQILEEGVDL